MAIGKDVAAIYDPAASEIRSYNTEGDTVSISAVPALDRPDKTLSGVVSLPVADLPHHMTFHDNDTLVLMEPTNLAATGVFNGALGTGFAAGDRLLYATDSGVAVVNWDTQAVEKIVTVDRGGATSGRFTWIRRGPPSSKSEGAKSSSSTRVRRMSTRLP